VAQLNADDLTTTEIDKLNLCALEFKISAGYFGRLFSSIILHVPIKCSVAISQPCLA